VRLIHEAERRRGDFLVDLSMRFSSPSGKRPERNENFMKKAPRKRAPTAEEIARMADRGVDISRYFTNRGRMMPPIQRVNVDFTLEMLAELDEAARLLNVSRQSVIKSLIRHGLDRRYLAERARRAPGG
jgi:hypothetical protein